jgi:KipI family sensor histidine kinase inhibitor
VPGIVETVPSYRALLVYYDPMAVGYAELRARLRALAARARPEVLPPSRTVELPCCYDETLGFELAAAAERLGLSPKELARLHASAAYFVDFIGFTPGLPYLSGLPDRIAIPRLEQPRVKTPPGSVSIGGIQCCIYSVESPGGFWVLGRTPVPLYDPSAPDPILLRAGDHVRFRAIERDEFDAIAASVAAGTYRPTIEPAKVTAPPHAIH